ncbi:type II toxin-antitoxin system HipA family toxin [Bifidobacterium oedipodis]|uniref:Transcriptional regulator n=1 Tax=Bifidobacterium oedipodis TaxID=2675322 RepID=A0A7Y0EQ97_9BIFI|nr:type II toxin-antitoxin system HipA family toxin [Bifidobacterium sp. DSM 109957]NMM94033.1 transcriptional regulator [Bifidobacterium sp. DSM 109957]
MKKPKELLVFVEDQFAGTLREDVNGNHSFTYDEETSSVPQLSLSMPKRAQPWEGRPVESFIDGILPDSTEVRRRIARQYGVNANNPFSLLTAIGMDCAGGVQFALPEDKDLLRQAAEYRPISISEIEKKLQSIAGIGGRSWQSDGEHWSLNGAQDKIALYKQEDQWFEALGAAATTHIVKPGIHQLHEQAFNEYVCMNTLRKLQIPVAESDFQIFGETPAIVSTRWDRKVSHSADGMPQVTRIHQEDLCQATGHPTAEKYQSDGGPGAAEILNFLRTNGFNAQSVMMFQIALIINFLIGGTDAHAKNYAILEPSNGQPTLAPLYDVASIFAYDIQPKNRKLAMSIGGEYRYDRIELRHWNQLAEETQADDFGLLQLLLYKYATELPDAFNAASADALRMSREILHTDQKTQELRRMMIDRIHNGINWQCSRIRHWFE